MRIFVVGLGAAGRRHLANAHALGHDAEGGRLDDAAQFGPEAIVVASPTGVHLEALQWAVDRGVHAFVEKPIAASSAGVSEVLAVAEQAGITVAVGHNLRFHPALEAIAGAVRDGRIGRLLSVRAEVGQYLPDWHPGEDYRASYAARMSLGGGALLTLSHELDSVRWIAGEVDAVRGCTAHVSSLELDVDDVAELVCRHAGGAVSSIHMDFLDRSYNRRSRWVGEEGTIAWEWGGPARLLPADETLSVATPDALEGTYLAALRDFVDAAATGRAPRCPGQDGLRTLEVCEAVVAALPEV
jgi:predicted dehydrogenase